MLAFLRCEDLLRAHVPRCTHEVPSLSHRGAEGCPAETKVEELHLGEMTVLEDVDPRRVFVLVKMGTNISEIKIELR